MPKRWIMKGATELEINLTILLALSKMPTEATDIPKAAVCAGSTLYSIESPIITAATIAVIRIILNGTNLENIDDSNNSSPRTIFK